ncbi:hypothetical protein ACJ2A9_21410 [Anaerobacillus sp. MEB173]|uniref:hypothetical protein n=1 Tax=Anaerobacillus sp. MEB173 TaxID=3383345 RepID=UPI003F901364
MELKELLQMKQGVVLQKDNRKRIVVGFDGMFVYYNTPSSKGTTGVSFSKVVKRCGSS